MSFFGMICMLNWSWHGSEFTIYLSWRELVFFSIDESQFLSCAMLCLIYYHKPPEKSWFFSVQRNCRLFFASMTCASIRIFPFWTFLTWRFSTNMHFILFVSFVFETQNSIWKWTTIDYEKVVLDLCLESFCTVQASILGHPIAEFSRGTSFYFLFILSTKSRYRGYGRVLWITITTCAERCFSWYAVDGCWLMSFAFVLHWYVDFIAMLTR